MTETIGTQGSGHPNLNLTAEEKQVYGKLLQEADPDRFSAISGDVAVKFFERTKLPPDVLGQIWQIADTENRGFLTPAGFGVVLRLIGHAQNGRPPSAQLATQVAPIPKFDSEAPSAPLPAASPPPVQASQVPASPAGPPPIRVPALSPDKVGEYSQLFEKSGAENGMLSGAVAKSIFERARLPNEVLGRIWGLSDTQSRGALDVTEFVIAMHMLASYKSGQMRGVPSTLPPGLYDAASRRPPRAQGNSRPGSGTFGQQPIPPQFSGQFAAGRPQSPIGRQQIGTPLSAQSTGEGWLITPAEKARFDSIFATVDKSGSGYISGEQAVEFFGNARLPEEALAQIWDLSDIGSEGRLDKDEFAVAMYLIRQQRGSRDGRANLPAQLPTALIPPSRRRQQIPPSQPTAPAFENAPVTKPKSAADDLFGLDAFGPAPGAQPQIPQSTGGTDAGPFGNAAAAPPPTSSPLTSSTFKPFMASSSFGQSLQPQSTGIPSPSQTRSISTHDDLLGDADPTESSRLTHETAELANLSNQVGTLSKQMTDLQGSRGHTEQELSQQTAQKRAFESRLGQLRTLYETEAKEVKALQLQLQTAKSDTKRLQSDYAMIDATHQDLSTQHQQLRAQLETDQRENAALKEKIRQMNQEVEQLKPQLEKIKSDARQQKGLVAINKKQLTTNEAERDRLRAEIEAAQKEIDDTRRETEESARQAEEAARHAEEAARQAEASKRELEAAKAAAARTTKSPHAGIASPAPSTSSNPFFNRTASTASAEEAPAHNQSNFDSIFGPSFAAAGAVPAPSTSFRAESPAQPASDTIRSIDEHTSSPVPDVHEPPAPPSNKQITSEALPFRQPLSRNDSMSDSVKVNHPLSRLSPADTPRTFTPASDIPTPPAHGSTEDPFAPSAADEEQESVKQTLPTGPTSTAEDTFGQPSTHLRGLPGAFPDAATPRAETPAEHPNPTVLAAGAGAAAIAGGAVLGTAAVNGEEKGKERAKSLEGEKENFDEYFGSAAHQRTASEQVRDFDSAFAGMKSSAPANGTAAASSKEFPDIQEHDDDDDDDDDDSSDYSQATPMAFEDNFNSPQKTGRPATESKGKEPEVASAVPSRLQSERPGLESRPSTGGSLPDFNTAERQISPPGYGDVVPEDNPTHFPREYKGLLPEREDPTSPPAGGETTVTTPPAGQAPPPSYGPEVGERHPSGNSEKPPAPPPKTTVSPFDFDSAFASMTPAPAPAEEDSDEEEEEEHTHFQPRKQKDVAHEFDPSFDSPTQSRSTTAASNQPHMSAYSAVTNGSPAPPAKDDFFHFGGGQATQSTTASAQIAPSQAVDGATGGSHDWDDIFAGLAPNGPTASRGFGDEDAFASKTSEVTSPHHEPSMSSSIQQTPPLTTTSPTSTTQKPFDASTFPHPPPPEPKEGPERPALGRAVSTTSEHDDPILKRLTAMGWSRTESLDALEKYDYNIDKAADYLTFKS